MDPKLDIIFSRRSIRRYAGEALTEQQITSLLEAGMAAPSANNKRPWHFIAITDRNVLAALAKVHRNGKMLPQAALAIAVCGDPSISGWWVQDCSAATENILIAAVGLGLGAVWLGCHGNRPREEAIRNVLGVPQGINVLSLVSIGHPAESQPARTQYDPGRVHKDQW